jgi:hypothetical protein
MKNPHNAKKIQPKTESMKTRRSGFVVASNVKSGNQECHECLEFACDVGMTACEAHDLCHRFCIQ